MMIEPDAMKALRGPLSRRATSAEFNEWNARDVVDYVDTLLSRLAEAERDAGERFCEIERLYYAEGKDLSWRAAHMRAIAENYFTDRALAEKGTDDDQHHG